MSTVEFSRKGIRLSAGSRRLELPSVPLPERFLLWQSSARMELFSSAGHHGAASVRTQPAHIAVLATSGNGTFGINLASRGMGVLPAESVLERFTILFEEAKEETEDMAPADSLPRRMEAVRQFYSDWKNFDDRFLGGLEIFEGRTEKNLLQNPLASLLYSGPPPEFMSFQLNGAVRVFGRDDPYYRFLRAARELFARDPFHVRQHDYPKGYLFYVSEVLEKTPRTRESNVQKDTGSD